MLTKITFLIVYNLIANFSFSQEFNIYSFGNEKISYECIEDHADDAIEYVGTYEFKHFGIESLVLEFIDDKFSLKKKFFSLTREEEEVYSEVNLNGINLTATDLRGEELEAKFIRIICDVIIQEENFKGYYGLLLYKGSQFENAIYIKIGD